MNKLYRTVVAMACFGAIGALIASVISLPVQAQDPCAVRPWLPECIPRIIINPHERPGCDFCPLGNIFDHREWLTIDHDWNATVSAKHGQDSVTFSVTVPNEVIDVMKTKASLELQNSTMK